MCGRYSLVDHDSLTGRFKRQFSEKYTIGSHYNIAPGQYAPVVTQHSIEMMRWGLVPSWAKEFKTSFSSINARGETLLEKPLWRGPFRRGQRCLIPADGYYEWLHTGTAKQPYYYKFKNGEVFSFAGLYDTWHDAEGHPLKTFAIITTTPNELAAEVHDRMPVILSREEELDWLDPDKSPEDLLPLLNPLEPGIIEAYRVDPRMGNTRNEGPDLIKPLE